MNTSPWPPPKPWPTGPMILRFASSRALDVYLISNPKPEAAWLDDEQRFA